jgi:redox-sensitive bicupin YhaK (pirin superfamily)
MKTILHPANERGSADHGWLKAKHSFSFASYYNPEKMGFGALRVLNDDEISAGMGFGTHPHQNMEILTIPLEGDLEHKDSMGHGEVIRHGDVQVMSAGTGITHSEFNHHPDRSLKLLQIWIKPKKINVKPRYQQISIANQEKGRFYQILSPSPEDEGVWIHQDAWFYLGDFDHASEERFRLHEKDSGIYVMVIEGTAVVEGKSLTKRDAMGVWDTKEIKLNIGVQSKVLVMEVPMS